MQTFFENFFTDLGISTTSITVQESGEDLSLRIETPDSPLLIGMHGKNLEAFQHLFGRLLEKKHQKFIHVHMEVNDYMKTKDDRLFGFLDGKIRLVQETGKSIPIRNLSSFERKKAHNYIAEKHIEGISTRSEGEGAERSLLLMYTGTLLSSEPKSTQTPTEVYIPKKAPEKKESPLDMLSEDGVGI